MCADIQAFFTLRGPGQAVAAAEIEEFDGTLGAAAGGDVAVRGNGDGG